MKKNFNEKYMLESNGYVWHNPFYAEIEKRKKEQRIENHKKDVMKKVQKMNKSGVEAAKFTVKVNRRDINNVEFDMPTNPSAYRKIKFR